MCNIPHAHRRAGRYTFRRRVHFRNLISTPLSIALGTADPKVARTRASILSARFVRVKSGVDAMLEDGRRLSGPEIEALFRAELEAELTSYVHSAYENASWSSSVPEVAAQEAEAYKIIRRPDRELGLTDQDRAELVRRGLDADIGPIEEYAQQIRDLLRDDVVAKRLEAVGAPVHAGTIAVARTHLIRAAASACVRVQRVFDDDIMDAADPIAALMADLGPPAEVRRLTAPTEPTVVPVVQSVDSQFQIYDPRLFSAAIPDVLASLKADGIWKGDLKQQRRIMETFAWITGDKPLGAYTHLDAAMFKKRIQQLPARFYYGTSTKGAMSRPWSEVIAELPPVAAAERRNPKTTNRDLSTMATVAKHLATTSWKPRMPGAIVMDFGAGRIAIKDDPNVDTRPPWTTAHLEHLFRSPIYTGGGGALKRLRADGLRCQVWHDAAYFLPLLWFYHHSCREETGGLEVADVITNHAVPHLHIRDNLTRGRDGEMAGEKRGARNRKLPIHAELRRLGFLDYVEAIRAEGHVALFPELYVNEEKRGGAHFYERAWQHMVDYIAERLPLPINPLGKGPDIHSIRALGSSFYEVDGVNALMRADVMGHAREGTNGKHYSKRMATEGLDVVLPERREFIERYVPTITGDIDPQPIRLLPLESRSRVGAGVTRKRRSDAGTSRAGDLSQD
ncbi:hypothetical protein [Sphingomonas sp. BAUL-RG-20F-R05-02]|uniref:hypothetical protein n=1 Tax=Sphingomonas sp. BAUL-RG-20F-R05-02 TaxID=2914830 RepID=UPI001F58BE41|nr:hypothetical protein [Sphingomonas sp. BAUL-RG-20F-R05-02]